MRNNKPTIVLACILALTMIQVDAKIHRSAAAVAAFKRANPCPANGAHRGSCQGYIVDHVVPLCAGGDDAPSNMQWQSVADAKTKDTLERRQCAALRKQR